MASWGVLANAQINIIGNLAGFRGAMREAQTQLWGMMTIANRLGGSLFQNLVSPFMAYKGMARVQAAQAAGQPKAVIQAAALAGGKTLLLAGVFIGLGRTLVSATKYASDFQEELNKIRETFGQTTASVMRNINEMARYGVNRTEMMRGVGTMGVELLGSGMPEGLAASLATKLARRALDVSSQYNIDQGEAINKFKSGLAGFGRPLKDLGIIISEDRVEVEAFVAGLWDGHSALTDEIKLRARASMILRETQRAEGDYIRTNMELANQFRALQGNFSNLMSTLGDIAIVPVQGATYALNALLTGINDSISGLLLIYRRFYRDPVYKFFSGGASYGEDEANRERLATRFNQGVQSRAYADSVIADAFLGKGRSANHMGVADVYKKIQEGVFNDKGRVQLDLTRRLVDLTERQVELLRQLGHTNFVGRAMGPT